MAVKLIWAQSRNQVIGNEGKIPWHIPGDLKRLRRLTEGHAVIMGRKTWESIGSRPLPDRINLVATRDETYDPVGATAMNDLEYVLDAYSDSLHDLWVLGGQDIYDIAEPWATEAHITVVDQVVVGDTYAPLLLEDQWDMFLCEEHGTHRFEGWVRKAQSLKRG